MLYPGCEAKTCNSIPEKLESTEKDGLLENMCKNAPNINDCKDKERALTENAEGNIDLLLQVNSCSDQSTKKSLSLEERFNAIFNTKNQSNTI